MKLVLFIWAMSFLIGICTTACGQSPSLIKSQEESKAKCKAECSSVSRAMDEWATGFSGTCKCKGAENE